MSITALLVTFGSSACPQVLSLLLSLLFLPPVCPVCPVLWLFHTRHNRPGFFNGRRAEGILHPSSNHHRRHRLLTGVALPQKPALVFPNTFWALISRPPSCFCRTTQDTNRRAIPVSPELQETGPSSLVAYLLLRLFITSSLVSVQGVQGPFKVYQTNPPT